MRLADLTTLVAVVGALVLMGLDKIDVETLMALLLGVGLRSPLAQRDEQAVV